MGANANTTERAGLGTAVPTGASAGDHVIVGTVAATAPLLGMFYVRTARGALVRVATTPTTILRSRRRRGLAWSETTFVRLADVRDGGRVTVRGASVENGSALRATVVLVGDVARFLWCAVVAFDAERGELTLRPVDGGPITVELARGCAVREFDSPNAVAGSDARHARPEAAFDERAVERLSNEVDRATIAAGDTVLALVEPAPTLGRALATSVVRVPPPARSARRPRAN